MVADPDYRPLFRLRAWHAAAAVLLFMVSFVAMMVLNPPAPTTDMLAEIDKAILRECQKNQLYCTTSEPTGFYDHGKLFIQRFPDNQCHVKSIRLNAAQPEDHLPLLSKLPKLDVVIIPRATDSEIAWFKYKYANLEFKRE